MMRHYNTFIGLVLMTLVLVLDHEAAATPPPPLPKPCEVSISVVGQPKIGETFDVIVKLSNAASDINGQVYLYLSGGLELVQDARRDMTLTPASTQTRRFTVKLVSGEKHAIRASFSEDIGKGYRNYSAVSAEKYIDLTSLSPVRDEVEYGFFSNDQVKIDTATGRFTS
jgi:hypothetical protein